VAMAVVVNCTQSGRGGTPPCRLLHRTDQDSTITNDGLVFNARRGPLCTDQLRKRRGNVGLDQIADPADPVASAADQLQNKARMLALSDALATLSDRQAQAVSLRHLEGLSNPEIAEIMDISVTSVESLTARGKRGLSAALSARKQELGYVDG